MDFPETQVLHWSDLGGFLIVAKSIGDSLSHRLAMCCTSDGFSGSEVHGEFGVRMSPKYSNWATSAMGWERVSEAGKGAWMWKGGRVGLDWC